MDLQTLLIYAIGAVVVLTMLRYLITAQSILDMNLQHPKPYLAEREKLPEYMRELYETKETELLELGFTYSQCREWETTMVKKHIELFSFLYFHPETKSYASLRLAVDVDPYMPMTVSFHTEFTDGTSLSTTNATRHFIIGQIPDNIIQNAYTDSLETQWAMHLNYLKKNPDLEIKELPKTREAMEEMLNNESESFRKYLEHLEKKHYIYKSKEGPYLVRTLASLRFARQLFEGVRKVTAIKQKLMKEGKRVEIPLELEVKNYENTASDKNPKNSNKAGKVAFLLFTVVMFVVAFGFLFNFKFALLLLVVALIHESGHLLAMFLFGYKDLRMLLVPLFGAVTMGSDKGVAPYKRIITLFAGPVPGILVAGVLLAVHVYGNVPILFDQTVLMFFILLILVNYFNLIPVMPLDGGQIMNTVLFSRSHLLQSIFLVFSLVAMVAAAFLLKEPLLLLFSLIIPFGYKNHFTQKNLTAKLEERFIHRENPTESEIAMELFTIMREPPSNNYSSRKKHTIAEYAINHFNTPKTPLRTSIVTLVFYTFIFVLPVVYIIAPIVSGKPLPFRASAYPYKNPADIIFAIEKLGEPAEADIKAAASRFQRVDRSLSEGSGLLFHRDFYRLKETDESMRTTVPESLAKLWARFGKPDLITNGFSYTLKDKKSGLVFTIFCNNAVVLTFGGYEKDTEDLLPVLYLFHKLLKRTEPADCQLEIDMDETLLVYFDPEYDSKKETDLRIGHKIPVIIGWKNGQPIMKRLSSE
jgi:Zn-dependent protease